MIPSTAEAAARAKINAAIVQCEDCDLVRRVKRELRRKSDKHSPRLKMQAEMRAAIAEWAFDNLGKREGRNVLALAAHKRFVRAHGVTVGKRAFYDALREDGYTLVKMDPFGREGSGPLCILDTEFLS